MMRVSAAKKTKVTTKGEVRKLLTQIVKISSRGNHDHYARALWHVLTALRGPDSNDEFLKRETTAKIRYAIGIRLGFACGPIVVEGIPKLPRGLPTTPEDNHFQDHVAFAIEALEKLGYIHDDEEQS